MCHVWVHACIHYLSIDYIKYILLKNTKKLFFSVCLVYVQKINSIICYLLFNK